MIKLGNIYSVRLSLYRYYLLDGKSLQFKVFESFVYYFLVFGMYRLNSIYRENIICINSKPKDVPN